MPRVLLVEGKADLVFAVTTALESERFDVAVAWSNGVASAQTRLRHRSSAPSASARINPFVQVGVSPHDKCATLSMEQKAGLDFAFLNALYHPWSRRNDTTL